jgi:hypothetical protein
MKEQERLPGNEGKRNRLDQHSTRELYRALYRAWNRHDGWRQLWMESMAHDHRDCRLCSQSLWDDHVSWDQKQPPQKQMKRAK